MNVKEFYNMSMLDVLMNVPNVLPDPMKGLPEELAYPSPTLLLAHEHFNISSLKTVSALIEAALFRRLYFEESLTRAYSSIAMDARQDAPCLMTNGLFKKDTTLLMAGTVTFSYTSANCLPICAAPIAKPATLMFLKMPT
jgi:hypothetical protein